MMSRVSLNHTNVLLKTKSTHTHLHLNETQIKVKLYAGLAMEGKNGGDQGLTNG